MLPKINIPSELTGLTDSEILASRNQAGYNQQQQKVKSNWWRLILDIVKEPMLLLLIAIAVI